MGKSQSRPDTSAIERAAREAGQKEGMAMAKQQSQEMKRRDEMFQQELNHTTQMQAERMRQVEADRRENRSINEKLMLKMHEGEERTKAERQSQLQMFQASMQEHNKMIRDAASSAMQPRQSFPDTAAIEQAAREAGKAEAMVKQKEAEMKHQEEMLQQQLRQTTQMQEERMRQVEADRKENKQINEKLLLKLEEKEERAKADQQNQLEMFQKTMQENQKMMQDLVKLAQEDPDLAVERTNEWKAKVEALEQERDDWAAAEKAKSETLMRESPPPFALMKDPPKTEPLFTEQYPCFAVMGKAGTGKSSLINAIAKHCGKPGPPPCRVGAASETTHGEPAPVFITLPNGVSAAFFDRPGAGAVTGGGNKFVQDQGLKWWTGVIVSVDSRVGLEDAVINRVCEEIKTPVISVRNKFEEDLKKDIETKQFMGQRVDEASFEAECRDYMRRPEVGMNEVCIIDTGFPEKYDFHKVLSWLEKHSKKISK